MKYHVNIFYYGPRTAQSTSLKKTDKSVLGGIPTQAMQDGAV